MIEPYYEDMSIRLYNNDMKDVVGLIDDGSIDLMLTDPPYGINYVSNRRKEKLKSIENDDVLYMDIDLFWPKIKETGSLWSFYSHKIELSDNCSKDYDFYKRNFARFNSFAVGLKNMLSQEHAIKSDMLSWVEKCISDVQDDVNTSKLSKPHLTRIKNRIIWVKNNWSAGDLEGDFGNRYECIAFMPKSKFKLKGYRYSNVWEFGKVPPTNHPTEKPGALISRIIECSTNVGDLVYDPFVGSGITLFECKRMGRRFVGSEIDEGHCMNIVNDNRLKQMGLGI